jgi:hypothetical protein
MSMNVMSLGMSSSVLRWVQGSMLTENDAGVAVVECWVLITRGQRLPFFQQQRSG